ncbi:MAG: cytochrome c [Bacteroidia bacterium]
MNLRSNKIKTILWLGWPLLVIGGLLMYRSFSGQGTAGQKIYQMHCASCHMAEGEGLRQLIPPLRQADYFVTNGLNMACIIRNGLNTPIKVNGVDYNRPMPGNILLSPAEITAVIGYIQKKWYPRLPEVNFQEVEAALQNCDPNQ